MQKQQIIENATEILCLLNPGFDDTGLFVKDKRSEEEIVNLEARILTDLGMDQFGIRQWMLMLEDLFGNDYLLEGIIELCDPDEFSIKDIKLQDIINFLQTKKLVLNEKRHPRNRCRP